MSANRDKITGRAKQIEGKLSGDKIRVAQGTVQRAKGDIEDAMATFARDVKRGVRRAKAGLRSAERTRGR
jgi:uncharacterized protein YjbJ (UPF0337 family)